MMQKMIEFLSVDLKQLETQNRESMQTQFQRLKDSYQKALDSEQLLDP